MSKATIKAIMFSIYGCSLAAIVCFVSPVFFKFYARRFVLGLSMAEYTIIACIIGVMLVIIALALNALRNRLRLKYEYDEFGVKKKLNLFNIDSTSRKEIEMQKLADMERVIPRSVLEKATKKGAMDPKAELDSLIGLNKVKTEVNSLWARINFEIKQQHKKGYEVGHMVFFGNAGTGKTTVARIITGMLYKYKLIKYNKIIEIDGNFLKSGNAEDTAIKTKALIRKAYGGVLFIDEAYALAIDGDVQGNQAVATLIKEMEDNRDKFVCILAGYPKEMKGLLDSNPGFRSRIKTYIEFPDYNATELTEIAFKMASEQDLVLTADAMDAISVRLTKEKDLPSWGNARTVRNIIDESINRHALRVQYIKDKKEQFTITRDDVSTKCNDVI